MGSKGGGGGGSVQVPRLFTPSGLYQDLSNVEGLAQGAQSLFGPLASAAGWAQGLATGFQTQQPSSNFLPGGKFAVQQGPTVTLTNGYTGNQAEQWTSSYDPTTDLITVTNEVTGERLYDYGGNQLQYQQQGTQGQHISFGNLPYAQWEQLRQQYVNSPQGQGSIEGVPGQGTITGLPAGKSAGQAFASQLGPALQPAWEQIQAIPRLEAKAGQFTASQIAQEQQFLGQGNTLFGQGQTMETQGAPMIAAGEQTWNTGENIIGQGQQVITQGQPLIGLGEGIIGEGQPFIDAAGNIIGQGGGIVGTGENIVGQGENLLNFATGGTGLFPGQQAFVEQQTQAEQNQLSQQLAAEGLGSSTANAILRGEAAQQGAATAGQLIQGNINAADQTISTGAGVIGAGNQTMQTGAGVGQLGTNIIGAGTGVVGAGNQTMQTGAGIIGAGAGVIGQGTGQVEAGQQQIELGQNQISLAQQQYNLAQGASKLALGGQELQLGEETAMAQMALGMQGQLWTQAMQGYGTLGQMIQTTGQLYGIDVSGYSAILQAHVQQNQIAAQIAESNAQLQAQAAQSMGSGLGSIFGSMFGGGGSGGGIFGSGGLGGVFGGIGSLFGGAGGGAAAAVTDIAPLVAGLAF